MQGLHQVVVGGHPVRALPNDICLLFVVFFFFFSENLLLCLQSSIYYENALT